MLKTWSPESIWLRPRTDSASEVAVATGILGRILPSDTDDYDFLMEQALKGDTVSTYQLALALHEDVSVQRWLALGWMWIAGCRGFKQAQMMLAREMALASSDDPPPLPPDELLGLALNWLNAQIPVARASRCNPSPDDRQTHGVCVVSRIGDAESRDGRDIQARYKHVIGQEIGFAGHLIDSRKLMADLDERWPWATNVNRHFAATFEMMIRAFDTRVRFQPILLVGEPGCGKTSMLDWLCTEVGLPKTTISCAGVNDASGLASVTRGWSTSRPCVPFQAIADNECANPAIILDEIDKGSAIGGQNGSVMGAAINMLSSSGKYFDGCLMAEVDLGYVSFLATANSLEPLPVPLRERFAIFRIPQPGPEHFTQVLQRTIGDLSVEAGLTAADIPPLSDWERQRLFQVFIESNRSLRVLRRAYSLLLNEKMIEEMTVPRLMN